MSYFLNRVYNGLIFRSEGFIFHPLINILIIIVQFTFLFSSNVVIQMLLFSFIILENIIFGNSLGAFNIILAIIPLLIFLGGITYIFSGLHMCVLVLLRILNGGVSFIFFFAKTNPSELTRALENIYFPTKLAFLPALVLTLSPRIIKDAEETFETLRLRQLGGTFLGRLPKILAIFIASVLYRTEFLAQSLYFKGFGMGKRTQYKKVEFSKISFLRIFLWFIFSSCLIYIWVKPFYPSF